MEVAEAWESIEGEGSGGGISRLEVLVMLLLECCRISPRLGRWRGSCSVGRGGDVIWPGERVDEMNLWVWGTNSWWSTSVGALLSPSLALESWRDVVIGC